MRGQIIIKETEHMHLPQMCSKLWFSYTICLIICPLILKGSGGSAGLVHPHCQQVPDGEPLLGGSSPITPSPSARHPASAQGPPGLSRLSHCRTGLFHSPFGRWHPVTSEALISAWPCVPQGHLHFHFSCEQLFFKVLCLPKKKVITIITATNLL